MTLSFREFYISLRLSQSLSDLSITMSQGSQVSVSSASWSWMDICQLYSSDHFDVARCDLAHYHTRHESILCINILIIRFILITCTLPFTGPPVCSMLNLIQYCIAYIFISAAVGNYPFRTPQRALRSFFAAFFSSQHKLYTIWSLPKTEAIKPI